MADEKMPRSAKRRRELYFDQVDGEYLNTNMHFLTLPEPYASAKLLLSALQDIIEGAEEGLRNCESDAKECVEGAEEALEQQQSALQTAQELITRLTV